MKPRWIIHNDKRIFIADYSDLGRNLDAVHIEVLTVIEMLSWESLDSVLLLTNVYCTYATDILFWIDLLMDAFPKVNPYLKKRALIG